MDEGHILRAFNLNERILLLIMYYLYELELGSRLFEMVVKSDGKIVYCDWNKSMTV